MEILDAEFRRISPENETAITMLHYDADMLSKDVKNARVALYVLLGATVLGMVVSLFYQQDLLNVLLEGLFIISIFLFVIWYMDRNARAALIIGISAYISLTILYAIILPDTITKSILMKFVIIYYLAKGIIAALKIEKIRKNLRQYGEDLRMNMGTVI